MEEVWKDINLSNLPQNIPSHPLPLHRTAASTFHDFLSGAFRDPNTPRSPDIIQSPNLSLSNPFRQSENYAIYQPSTSAIADAIKERRWKKMIKNRESAARSRARKQASLNSLSSAYTNELEMEVAHLVQENDALKREQQKLKMELASNATSKRKLQRTSSSPF